jgi:predicted permease
MKSGPTNDRRFEYNEVGPGYFATTGIPLVSGREFTRADNETAPLRTIVNETMAAQYWRGRDPVGSRIQVQGKWMQVVGIARTSKYRNIQESPKPFLYIPLRQGLGGVNVNIRTSLPPEMMATALAREVRALDANLAPGEVITMREQVDRKTAPQRIAVMILGVFGGLAVVLASIGLYGVMSYTVSQSSREMALRLALGANRSDILQNILWQGTQLTAGALVVGVLAAFGLANLLGDLLYKVSPHDPASFAAAFAVIVLASLAACLIPALRATRTPLIHALKGGQVPLP